MPNLFRCPFSGNRSTPRYKALPSMKRDESASKKVKIRGKTTPKLPVNRAETKSSGVFEKIYHHFVGVDVSYTNTLSRGRRRVERDEQEDDELLTLLTRVRLIVTGRVVPAVCQVGLALGPALPRAASQTGCSSVTQASTTRLVVK